MKIERIKLLDDLNLAKSGLSPREFIEQSSCFVFQGGEVMTYNDEIACRKKTKIPFEGAVQATTLLDFLDKVPDTELEVIENKNGEIEFRGKRIRFAVTREAKIFLPIEQVERPKKWTPLAPAFTEAVSIVKDCVSQDHSHFVLT